MARPSTRCGECHTRIYEDWNESGGHAQSWHSPGFQAAIGSAKDSQSCYRCHAPLEGLPVERRVIEEGVNCEACHGMSHFEIAPTQGSYTLNLESNVKYGPICDHKDHYFHKLGCAPEYGNSEYCASCHHMYRELDDGSRLPVYTTFMEWKNSEYRELGMSCQSCHMEGAPGEVAIGWRYHDSVSGHAMLGTESNMIQGAVKLGMSVRGSGPNRSVIVQMENAKVGHFIPSGSPDRRLVLDLVSVGAGGNETPVARKMLGRVLVDAKGAVVPHHEATRVESDLRIGPGQTITETFPHPGTGAGKLRARLRWLEYAPELAKRYGITSPEEKLIAETSLAY